MQLLHGGIAKSAIVQMQHMPQITLNSANEAL
jgi:hypothetical protein